MYICTLISVHVILHITVSTALLQIYSKGLESSWIGYMTGQVEFNTKLSNSNTTGIMKLMSRDNPNKHAILTGGTYVL